MSTPAFDQTVRSVMPGEELGISDAEIDEIEALIGGRCSPALRDFLRAWAGGSVCGTYVSQAGAKWEVDFVLGGGALGTRSIPSALRRRLLPPGLVPICEDGFSNLYAVDMNDKVWFVQHDGPDGADPVAVAGDLRDFVAGTLVLE